MRTRLIFADFGFNLEIYRKKFEKKYDSYEDIQQLVLKNQCNSPEAIDDFILWQSINTIEKQLNSADQELSNTSFRPDFTFREEIINYSSEFYEVLTPRRMELLEYIYKNRPDSVKNLALSLNRDYKNVYDDLIALERFQLIEFLREGKNKRPVSRLTAIEVIFNK